jgi:acetyltransferase-like isoleucine patch superfamily enzyme
MGTPRILRVGITDVAFGANVTVVKPANIYGCHIGDDCFIGPFVEIQKGVTIGKRCRIQSHAFICEMVTIGDDCFISHGAMFINDVMKSGQPSYEGQTWKSTQVGNNVVIGTNAVILPCRICDNALIGAGSVVTKNIDAPGIYAGNPAKLLRPLDS